MNVLLFLLIHCYPLSPTKYLPEFATFIYIYIFYNVLQLRPIEIFLEELQTEDLLQSFHSHNRETVVEDHERSEEHYLF